MYDLFLEKNVNRKTLTQLQPNVLKKINIYASTSWLTRAVLTKVQSFE